MGLMDSEISSLEAERARLAAEREALARGARHPLVAAAPVFLAICVPLLAVLGVALWDVPGRMFGVAVICSAGPAAFAGWRVYARRERIEAGRAESLEALRRRIRAVDRRLEGCQNR